MIHDHCPHQDADRDWFLGRVTVWGRYILLVPLRICVLDLEPGRQFPMTA